MPIVLLAILPNWNSLDSVRQVHSNLEAAGLVFFALLVVAEALAHISKQEKREHLFDSIGICFFAIAVLCEIVGYCYGQRNDALSEQKIRSLDALAEDAESTAKRAKTTADGAKTEADAIGKSAGELDQRLAAAKQNIAAVSKKAQTLEWSLDEVQFLSSRYILSPERLKAALSKFKGMPVIFRSYVNDGDGYFLCKTIVPVAQDAGIVPTDQCGMWPASFPFLTGTSITGPDEDRMSELSAVFGKETPFGATAGPYGKVPHSPNWIVFVGMKSRAFVGETAQTRDAERRAAEMKKKRSALTKP